MSNPNDATARPAVGDVWHRGRNEKTGLCQRWRVESISTYGTANPTMVVLCPIGEDDTLMSDIGALRLPLEDLTGHSDGWHVENETPGPIMARVTIPRAVDLDDASLFLFEVSKHFVGRMEVVGFDRAREEFDIMVKAIGIASAVVEPEEKAAIIRDVQSRPFGARGEAANVVQPSTEPLGSYPWDLTDPKPGVESPDLRARQLAAERSNYGGLPKPTVFELRNAIRTLTRYSHGNSFASGWWPVLTGAAMLANERVGPSTGLGQRNFGELISLIHSELSEALEGYRKDLDDEHLPDHKSVTVELADALHRIFDLAGSMRLSIAEAYVDKGEFNLTRADHKLEARAAEGGKRF